MVLQIASRKLPPETVNGRALNAETLTNFEATFKVATELLVKWLSAAQKLYQIAANWHEASTSESWQSKQISTLNKKSL